MGNDLYRRCRPLTAFPFYAGDNHREYPCCEALRPYVRCFWGSSGPVDAPGQMGIEPFQGLVIPDLCMDIIFTFWPNRTDCFFCGVDDQPFYSRPVQGVLGRFAIRLYCWAVPLLASESAARSANVSVDAEAFFPGICRELAGPLRGSAAMAERIALAEDWIFKKLNPGRESPLVLDALYRILLGRGSLPIGEICRREVISPRRLERQFAENTGLSPKKLSGLIRYQLLWRAVLSGRIKDPQDAVLRFGYTDQSHLLRDFKRYHTMTPVQAREAALSDFYKTNPPKP